MKKRCPKFGALRMELQWLRVAEVWQEYRQAFLRPSLTGGHWVDKEWKWDGEL